MYCNYLPRPYANNGICVRRKVPFVSERIVNKKILVVEDFLPFRKYLTQLLISDGYDVRSAENMAQANEILSQEQDFLCCILDYYLPDSYEGELIEHALSHNQKVIILTTSINPELRQQLLAKGVVDYLMKDSKASIAYLMPLVRRIDKNQHHKCLVVDDSITVRKHVVQLLERQYIDTVQATDGDQAIALLRSDPTISFVITDQDMPQKDGMTMIREIRNTWSKTQLPILGLSGRHDPTLTALFLKSGANDFLNKPFHPEEFYCRIHQILDMKEANTELYRMANQDALTQLWNRRYLFNHKGYDPLNSHVAMLDIDHFKKVNDTYGHDGGDVALVTVANILKLYFPHDLISRLGGEEFCIRTTTDFSSFYSRLEKLRQRIEATTIPFDEHTIRVTVSVGISNAQETLEDQLKVADVRLYLAKQSGRNMVVAH